MIARVLQLALGGLVFFVSVASAQPREPLPVFVLDAHAGNVGLPTIEGWTPPVPINTEVPARSLGFAFGGHVYVLRRGWGGLGVGSSILFARGKTSPAVPSGGTRPVAIPDVETRLRSLLPQVSVNFGHRLGWSYVSAGIGRAQVQGETTATPSIRAMSRDSAWVGTFHFGGGARWFINDHLGTSFDLRWTTLSAIDAAPKTRLFSVSAGVSIK